MRAYRLVGRKQIEFQPDSVVPVPGDDDVLVRVGACSVCGRSDLAYYHYLGLRDHCAQGCFGHEIAGEIVDVGSHVKQHRAGDRVFLRAPLTSGYAEYALAREIAVGRLPQSIPYEQGSILQLLPLAVHATRGVQLGDNVLIVGQGPVGLMALQVARLRGAASITTVDLDPWRLQRSAALGADRTVEVKPGEPLADHIRDVDVAIEAVGTPATANACVAATRHNGLVVFLGTHHVDTHVTFDMVAWEKKGLRVHTSAEPTDEARRAAMRQAQRLVDSGNIRLAELLTHRLTLEQLPQAMQMLSRSSILEPEGTPGIIPGPPPQTLKVAICP
ncbi:MAG: zinc-binding dehydrogenase [Burkholderiales bacterium]|jgi:2-desacetyl-2-hydroxyethyl bacteriochlorophyllide A dehydrogenase|nr:zinc-binding dehydrogenase [Burkholderiales bacterium]